MIKRHHPHIYLDSIKIMLLDYASQQRASFVARGLLIQSVHPGESVSKSTSDILGRRGHTNGSTACAAICEVKITTELRPDIGRDGSAGSSADTSARRAGQSPAARYVATSADTSADISANIFTHISAHLFARGSDPKLGTQTPLVNSTSRGVCPTDRPAAVPEFPPRSPHRNDRPSSTPQLRPRFLLLISAARDVDGRHLSDTNPPPFSLGDFTRTLSDETVRELHLIRR
jgi:hypothetical protein